MLLGLISCMSGFKWYNVGVDGGGGGGDKDVVGVVVTSPIVIVWLTGFDFIICDDDDDDEDVVGFIKLLLLILEFIILKLNISKNSCFYLSIFFKTTYFITHLGCFWSIIT